MQIDISIVSYNAKNVLKECIEFLLKAIEFDNNAYTIYVIDNASYDGSLTMVKKYFPQVQCIELKENHGFARAHNMVFRKSNGDYFVMLNPDAFVHEDALHEGIKFMHEHPQAGACGGFLFNEDGTIAPSARDFPSLWHKFYTMWGLDKVTAFFSSHENISTQDTATPNNLQPHVVDWVPGTFTIIRRNAFTHRQIFDERFFMYYEETDMCKNLYNNAWQVWFVPSVKVMHIGGVSAKAHIIHNENIEIKENRVNKNTNSIKDSKESFISKAGGHYIDDSGVQLNLWRMQSENLYWYKHISMKGVITSCIIESTRHIFRIVSNTVKYVFFYFLYKEKSGQKFVKKSKYEKMEHVTSKIHDSKRKLQDLYKALRNTHFGRISPPIPWK